MYGGLEQRKKCMGNAFFKTWAYVPRDCLFVKEGPANNANVPSKYPSRTCGPDLIYARGRLPHTEFVRSSSPDSGLGYHVRLCSKRCA